MVYTSDEDKVRYAKNDGIIDSITLEKNNYPPDFYLVLENLDLVTRVWLREDMGTSGTWELAQLLSVLVFDIRLWSHIPKEAYAYLKCICNPKERFTICTEADLGHGDMIKAYYYLRKYLIDNKERVIESYNAFYKASKDFEECMKTSCNV